MEETLVSRLCSLQTWQDLVTFGIQTCTKRVSWQTFTDAWETCSGAGVFSLFSRGKKVTLLLHSRLSLQNKLTQCEARVGSIKCSPCCSVTPVSWWFMCVWSPPSLQVQVHQKRTKDQVQGCPEAGDQTQISLLSGEDDIVSDTLHLFSDFLCFRPFFIDLSSLLVPICDISFFILSILFTILFFSITSSLISLFSNHPSPLLSLFSLEKCLFPCPVYTQNKHNEVYITVLGLVCFAQRNEMSSNKNNTSECTVFTPSALHIYTFTLDGILQQLDSFQISAHYNRP